MNFTSNTNHLDVLDAEGRCRFCGGASTVTENTLVNGLDIVNRMMGLPLTQPTADMTIISHAKNCAWAAQQEDEEDE